jgi:lysophospholipase L1-like esterase
MIRASLMLLVALCLSFGPRAAADSSKWEKDIQAFEAADANRPPGTNGTVFIGSSSIRLWKTLAHDFPEDIVINRGFGGSQMIDSVQFFERIVLPCQPARIVIYAGGNDINAGKSPEQVFADYKQFVEKVRASLPQTRVAYISIAPNPARWHQVDQVRMANRLIQQHTRSDERLVFIDAFSAMLGDDGKPRPEIFVEDRLHMNEQGYQLWAKLVRQFLMN